MKQQKPASTQDEKTRFKLRWLLYPAIALAYVIIYVLTDPDASYIPNESFQLAVAVGLAICLVRSLVHLYWSPDTGQMFKVIFWAGFVIYTLSGVFGKVSYFFHRVNSFPYAPEALVLTYIIGVIIKEGQNAPKEA